LVRRKVNNGKMSDAEVFGQGGVGSPITSEPEIRGATQTVSIKTN